MSTTEFEGVDSSSKELSAVDGGKNYAYNPLLGSPFDGRNLQKRGNLRYFDPHCSEDAVNRAIEVTKGLRSFQGNAS